MDQHKIHVKIGAHEFEAEGREELVQGEFLAFLAALAAHVKARQENEPTDKVAASTNRLAKQWWLNIPFDFHKLYDVSPVGETVALRSMPIDEFDALVLVLYGVQAITNLRRPPLVNEGFCPDTEINLSAKASNVIASAKKSDIEINRIDRIFMLSAVNLKKHLVCRHGSKKGSYYYLSPQGREYAEQVAQRVLAIKSKGE